MPFFHVLVQYRNGADKTHCVFSDLSEKEVKARFVRPYLKGERIQSGTDVIDVMEITCVRVIETAESNDEERAKLHASEQERIDAINRAPNGIRFLALAGGYEPEDIVDAGPDVTSRFISAAPGSNQGNVLIRAVHNPWVVGVGAGVISAVVLVWLELSGR